MKNSLIILALVLAASVAPALAKKTEHVPFKVGKNVTVATYKTGKFVATTSPAGYVKYGAEGVSYPFRHPVKSAKFLF